MSSQFRRWALVGGAQPAITDAISLPEAVKQSIRAALPAYALFGADAALGVHYSNHGHPFTAEDWTAMMDFFDKNLRGKKTDRTFDHFLSEQELDEAGKPVRKPSKRQL